MKHLYLTLTMTALAVGTASAGRILHVPMDLKTPESITESVSGRTLSVYSKTRPENIAGAAGMALRLDGFSTYALGPVNAGASDAAALTISMWVAPETYPVIELDTPTSKKACLAGTLDDTARSGWQFSLGYTGKYSFDCYSGGWKVSVEASDVMPCYEWSCLTAVLDGTAKTVTLYRNGVEVGSQKAMNVFDNSASTLYIGKDAANSKVGPFFINTFNGLIDDIEVQDTALTAAEIAKVKPANPADLSVPESRYADQLLRPRFHGMPATAWTNESHGMTYSNGRWHVFFQKNANGPYMTRLHWGHISSDDLLNWREERIAIAPGEAYDIKGCWSGAVVTDDVLTGGRPAAIYTAVDYAKATICMATPHDDDLLIWNKRTDNPLINGRPAGLSDDFRDPYFFRNGDDAYIIVGTQKDGLGACTLHKMDPSSKRFTNDGRIFFRATNASEHGTFWEMPNLTPMADGRWLFTVTPMGTSQGVRCLYWVGSIASDGTFRPEFGPKTVEMSSRDGYGLLSPTVYNHEGKTIALGIVPDKIGGNENYSLGWAHCYSLPREWSLAADGTLLQKPYEGVKALRSATAAASLNSYELTGEYSLPEVAGRHAELLADFKVGSVPFGFKFFAGSNGEAKLYYNPASGELVCDLSALNRWNNDGGSYAGVYRMTLPEPVAAGDDMKINLFIDGSIIDIFVNDRFAQSIRVFPQAADADGISVFAEAKTLVKTLNAWAQVRDTTGVGSIPDAEQTEGGINDGEAPVNVFHISGRLVKSGVSPTEATSGLESGIYIINGRKVRI